TFGGRRAGRRPAPAASSEEEPGRTATLPSGRGRRPAAGPRRPAPARLFPNSAAKALDAISPHRPRTAAPGASAQPAPALAVLKKCPFKRETNRPRTPMGAEASLVAHENEARGWLRSERAGGLARVSPRAGHSAFASPPARSRECLLRTPDSLSLSRVKSSAQPCVPVPLALLPMACKQWGRT